MRYVGVNLYFSAMRGPGVDHIKVLVPVITDDVSEGIEVALKHVEDIMGKEIVDIEAEWPEGWS